MSLKTNLKFLSHHVYCLVGGTEIHDELISILKNVHKISIQGNPDFFDRKYESFTVDDARELKTIHEMRPVTESGLKISILTMMSITIEAQNALLKLLEEPSDYSRFFIIIPSAHLLIPTVRSRIHLLSTEKSESSEDNIEQAKKFIKATKSKRLEIIKTLLDEVTKEKKNRQDVINFLNAVEEVIYLERGVKEASAELESIQLARKYVNDRAPSLKMLLEQVALRI